MKERKGESVTFLLTLMSVLWLVGRSVGQSVMSGCLNFPKRAGSYTFMLLSEHLFSIGPVPARILMILFMIFLIMQVKKVFGNMSYRCGQFC